MPEISNNPAPEPTASPPDAGADAALLASVPEDDENFDATDLEFLTPKPAAAPAPASSGASAPPVQPAAATPPQTPPGAPAVSSTPAPSPAPSPAAAAPSAATPPAPAPASAPAPTAAAPAPEPQAPVAAVPPVDPMASYRKWRAEGEALLASTHFKLSPELAEEIAGTPETAVPKLMSRVYLDAVENSVQAVTNMLPMLINSMIERRGLEERATASFFEKWPQLREHEQAVKNIGANWRRNNPQGTAEQYIQSVGAQAIIELGLLPTLVQAAAQPPAVTVPAQRPMVPVTVSAPRQVGTPTLPANVFEQLSMEPLYDD